MADRYQKSRTLADPRPGFYRMRLAKRAAYVPAIIYYPCPWVQPAGDVVPFEWCRPYDRGGRELVGFIGVEKASVDHIWTSGDPIARQEYVFRLSQFLYARANEPQSPAAQPNETVDISKLPPPEF